MSSSKRVSQPDEVFIIVEDPTPLSNRAEEIVDNSSQPEYSFQNNLIHFDYDSGLMIHQYLNGSTRYKGEWSKGCPNGNGIMYNMDGSIQFKGEWKHGEFEVDQHHHFFYKDDMMKVTYNNGELKYYGKWSNGQPNGKGKYMLPNGHLFKSGQWNNGLFKIANDFYFEYDSGLYIHKKYKQIVYRGELNESLDYDGTGKEYDSQGRIVYDGEWRMNKYNGKGKLYKDGKIVFDGEWRNSIPNGKGTFYENEKEKYKGNWIKGKCNIRGNKWYDYKTNTIQTLLPMKEETVRKYSKKAHSIDILDDKATSCISRCKCFLYFILILILIPIIHLIYLFFCTKGTAYYALEYYISKPFIRELTIATGCGNKIQGDLKISGYKKLQRLIIRGKTFQNVKSFELSDNPLLNYFYVQSKDYFDESKQSFLNMKGPVVFKNLPSLESIFLSDHVFKSASSLDMFSILFTKSKNILYPDSIKSLCYYRKHIDLPQFSRLVMGYGCFKNVQTLLLTNLPQLSRIVTDWQSFKRVKDFRLSDLENLSYVKFGSFTLSYAQTALFNNLPKLESLIFDCEVFKYTSNFTMTSNHYLCKSIIDLPSLNSFFLNSFSLENIQSISISDLPKLKTLRTRNNGFYKTESITLSSIIDTI